MYPVAMVMLEEDELLRKMRFHLVPKQVKEEAFWKNYFYRVSLIKQSAQLTALAAQQAAERRDVQKTDTSPEAGHHKDAVKRKTPAAIHTTKPKSSEDEEISTSPPVSEFVSDAFGNFVIRYGLVTNEIAMIQAQGRGRAEDSSYTLVEVKNSGVAEKECVNEYRKTMMNKAIDKIRALNQADYDKRIIEFQMQSIMEEKVRMTKKKQKGVKNENPSEVKFSCRGCSKHVCTGEDIEIIENMHRVNLTPEFCELFIQRENTTLQERLLDYETNGFIACKDCGQRWGSMMLYRGIECPCLHVKNFVVTLSGKKISKCTKWSELAIKFSAFDYAEHASKIAESSDEEDSMTC